MSEKRSSFIASVVIALAVLVTNTAIAVDLKIGLTQAQAGDARKFQPVIDYLAKKGIAASFVTAQDYPQAAEFFTTGGVNAMFCGSGIAGTMIIKGLGSPLARPVGVDGVSTYSAVVLAPKGSPKFTGTAAYFTGKKVIFAPLASAGEFYFQSLGSSKPAAIMKAASHGAAIDALSRGQADVAVVKNHVWTKEQAKFPGLEKVGGDTGENPDTTFIVAKSMDAATAQKIATALLGIKDDTSAEAAAVKGSLNIQGFIKTTEADFKHTLSMLKKAGVTKDFGFKF